MRRQCRAELMKICSVRRLWVLVGLAVLAVAGSLAVNLFQAYQMLTDVEVAAYSGPMTDEWRELLEAYGPVGQTAAILTSGQGLGIFLVLLFAILAVSDEARFRTTSTTCLFQPNRSNVLLAKTVAVSSCAALLWIATTAANLVGALIFFGTNDFDAAFASGTVWRAVGLNLCAYILWAALGIGIATLIRSHVAAAIVGTLIFMVDSPAAYRTVNSIQWLISGEEGRFSIMAISVAFPRVATEVMASTLSKFQGDPQHWWIGALVLLGYGVIMSLIGLRVTNTRDVPR